MSRIALAFGCFFRLLFGGRLPAAAAEFLPDAAKALPKPEAEPEREPQREARAVAKPPAATLRKGSDIAEKHREGALAVLALLQREGRLVDFLLEDIADYSDADIGAAVRDIHRGCQAVLHQHLEIEAVMPGVEEDAVRVPEGFDPSEIRLVGNIAGDPPFAGVLRHHGWRATRVDFPSLSEGVDRRVLAPAQVEIR